ncbi:DUF3772 domain-containing protein [Tropicimonas marinistellae]|uniref:DUF3772 domain-containing protein n=1 Tax=Tropicimonas marinistellae TaxID=1739787 RepID=UPI0008300E4C|nr:DUF3772 domain-containing protein [Tropicimonas marinistellae]
MQRLLAGGLALLLAMLVWIGVPPSADRAFFHDFGAAWAATDEADASAADHYSEWEKVATRAEEALAAARASNQAFEALRGTLVDWRAFFLEEQRSRETLITALNDRIEALGPVPEEGASESTELAALRADLDVQLQRLITPVRQAEEAYARAQGLISRVDHLLRERKTQTLLERGPSPLNPANVRNAFADTLTVLRIIGNELSSSLHLSSDRRQFWNNLPQITILLALSALLLTFGRPVFYQLVKRLVREKRSDDRIFVVAMILSLGQFLMPTIGIWALATALRLTEMFGSAGEGLLDIVPLVGAAFFAARWIGGQTFPRDENWPTPLQLSARQRVRGRFYSNGLGLLVGLAILLRRTMDLFVFETGTIAVLAFPIIALAAVCLDGLGRLILTSSRKDSGDEALEADETADIPGERRFIKVIGRFIGHACFYAAILGPVFAAIGYTRAGVFFTLSPGLTLGLLALVIFLQQLAGGLLALLAPSDRVGDGLLAVLAKFAIAFASLPFFAVIWGARWSDIVELWTKLNEGYSFGDVTVSPSGLFILLLVFGAGYVATRLLQGAVGSSVLPRTSLDRGAQKAVNAGLGYVGIFLSAVIAVSVAGLNLSNLAIVAGALSVGVGFGLQNIVSNFVSGLILLIERPVTEGDWIEVGGIMGTVKRISVRATTVETFDRTDVVVPNSDFVTGQVTNWTRGNLSGRLILPVGVAYGADTRKVAQILQEIAEEHPLVIVNPPPLIVFQGFGADALEFEMRVILRDINFGLSARTELNHRIAERFAEEGIEIPFAQRDIWLRNPEALVPGARMPSGGQGGDQGASGAVATATNRPDPEPYLPSQEDD